MKDVIIIGNGPGGISTSLYLVRAGFDIMIIGKDEGALKKADTIENYYGFVDPIKASLLVENGIKQAKNLGVEVISDEVVSIGFEDSLVVETKTSKYKTKTIVMATGAARKTPKIDGLAQLEGRGVSYCAVCDGFFYRGKDVAVLGAGEYAMHEANALVDLAKSVTIFTDGESVTADFPSNFEVITDKIVKVNGENKISSVSFENGKEKLIDGLFVAVGVASSADLAKKIGAETKDNNIVVDHNMATNITGLYACGDCVGGILQIPKAIYEGMQTAFSIIKYLKANR